MRRKLRQAAAFALPHDCQRYVTTPCRSASGPLSAGLLALCLGLLGRGGHVGQAQGEHSDQQGGYEQFRAIHLGLLVWFFTIITKLPNNHNYIYGEKIY